MLRQSILNIAIEGKLVSQEPDDESSKAMLGRIGQGQKWEYISENV